MFDLIVWERDMRMLEKMRRTLPEEKLKKIDQAVEDRLELHLLQNPVPAHLDKEVVGGRNLFGVVYRPRNKDEPYRCEANYVIETTVNKDGKPLARDTERMFSMKGPRENGVWREASTLVRAPAEADELVLEAGATLEAAGESLEFDKVEIYRLGDPLPVWPAECERERER